MASPQVGLTSAPLTWFATHFNFSSFRCSNFLQDRCWLGCPISNGSLSNQDCLFFIDKIIFLITIWVPDLAVFYKLLPVSEKKNNLSMLHKKSSLWKWLELLIKLTLVILFIITWAWKSGRDSSQLTSVSVPLSCLFSVEHGSSFPVLFFASLASSSFLCCHFHTAITIF